MNDSNSKTRASLLQRLRDSEDDQAAWNELVDRYGPKIRAWCFRWGLQENDVQDVTQKVLFQLVVKIRQFVYDPSRSFRAWLKTLTRHAWSDFLADEKRAVSGSGDDRILQLLETVEAGADLETHLKEVFDLELLELASACAQERVDPRTWEAFQLTAIQQLSGAEAASRLGMPVASVFKAKSNVQKLIKEEIRRLEGVEAS